MTEIKQKKTYDPKCEELARHFLENDPLYVEEDVFDLAQQIQECCDSFFEG